MVSTALITGANSGLGKDSARQLALLDDAKKIYLACRSQEKGDAAKAELEEATGKKVFQVLVLDVSNTESVKKGVESLKEPVEALIMNAGGPAGVEHGKKRDDGVINTIGINVLGHVLLFDELVKANKLTKVAVYAGSEAARGIPAMGMARPVLKNGSVEEFVSIADGSFFGEAANKSDFGVTYGVTKYFAAMWMSAMARKYPHIRCVTISPGATTGTAAADNVSGFQKFMFKHVAFPIMTLFGNAHKLEDGAKRYVDAVVDDETYKSGVFYASKKGTSGAVGDQAELWEEFKNEQYQDNADEAIHKFIATAS